MSVERPASSPEKKEVLDDNARKFVVGAIDHSLLHEYKATSFTLTTDWLETEEDKEKKLAFKEFDNGEIQILLIAKVTKDGNRTTEKEKITTEKYEALLASSILRLEKKRYEFTYIQNNMPFSMKYDEFADSALNILEVDADSNEARNLFTPSGFPSELTEVTGDMTYYGYRVASVL